MQGYEKYQIRLYTQLLYAKESMYLHNFFQENIG